MPGPGFLCGLLKRGGGLALAGSVIVLAQVRSACRTEQAHFLEAEPAVVKAELIPERLWVEPGKSFGLWLKLRIEPGWHIYWKNPGDSGLPTTISWQLPAGVNLLEISWPWPEKIVASFATSYGYEKQVLILARFALSSEVSVGSPLRITAEIGYLVCREGCLAGSCASEITLRVKKEKPPENKKYDDTFLDGRSRLPGSGIGWTTRAEADGAMIRILLQPPEKAHFNLLGADFFIENEGVIDYSTAAEWEKDTAGFILRLRRAPGGDKLPSVLKGVLVLNAAHNQGKKKAFNLQVPLKEIK